MPGFEEFFASVKTDAELARLSEAFAEASAVLDALRPRPYSALADMHGLFDALPADEMEYAPESPRARSAPLPVTPVPARAPSPAPRFFSVQPAARVDAIPPVVMDVEEAPAHRVSQVAPFRVPKRFVPRSEKGAIKKDIPEGSRKRAWVDGGDDQVASARTGVGLI